MPPRFLTMPSPCVILNERSEVKDPLCVSVPLHLLTITCYLGSSPSVIPNRAQRSEGSAFRLPLHCFPLHTQRRLPPLTFQLSPIVSADH